MKQPVQTQWLAALMGHPVDLEKWESELRHPHDPACERHLHAGERKLFLNSQTFQSCQTAEQVLLRAERVVSRLNGGIRAIYRGGPVVVWAIGHLDAQGAVQMTQFAYTNETMQPHDSIKVFLSGTAEQGDAENVHPPVAPPESAPQRWLGAATTDERVANLLDLGAKADNWIDIYKTYEAAKKLVGGEDKLHALLGSESGSAERLRRTANTHRHANPLPDPNPMPLNEATVLIGRLLVAAMRNAGF